MSRVPSLSRLAVDVATNALRCCAEPARKTNADAHDLEFRGAERVDRHAVGERAVEGLR